MSLSTPPPPDWLERANRLSTVARQLSNVVHEVNNLLHVIIGHAELLEMDASADPSILRRAQTMGAHAKRASALIGEVHALARDHSTDIEAVDLRDIAARALALRHYSLNKARVDAAVEADAGAWLVTGNKRRVMQIVLNLVINAEQALVGRTGGRLRLTLTRAADRVQLSVQDNGEGRTRSLPEAWTDALAAGPDRLGIGLQVVEWLAADQGGALTVQSVPGGGTSAVVVMPAAR